MSKECIDDDPNCYSDKDDAINRLLKENAELKKEIQVYRGALADIAGSRDMTLEMVRKKSQRIYDLFKEEK